MVETTLIRNAAWVIAWDGDAGEHLYLNDADVVFEGNLITHVGPGYAGEADRVIQGKGLLVMPGLVDIHSHPANEPMSQGINEELGSPRLYNSSLYEYMPLFKADDDGLKAAATVAYAELLMSGTTTLVDLSIPYDGWLELMAQSGLRGVLSPMYRSASWSTSNGYTVEYLWDQVAGREAMAQAMEVVDNALKHPSARLSGQLCPAQVDTCTPELLQASQDEARKRGLTMQVHAAQSQVEFNEMTQRHGVTPIQWLDALGVLDHDTTIGHGIYLDHHSCLDWYTKKDLGILARNQCSVAHCPNVFSRRGMKLEHFGAYHDAGVNLGIGTDTYPHNMIEELRSAIIFGRLASGEIRPSTAEVFNAATVGGAKALGRKDIGRLTPGAKADVVLVDLERPAMKPCREPLRSLIYVAAERAVRDVFVDGRQVVRQGRVMNLDYASAKDALEQAQKRSLEGMQALDFASRTPEEISPLTFSKRSKA
ncbi:MAG: amidohydrolase family protein [Deltaproteobacteria bacterium]|nr:amidohydrolase family protein [Deltaproteobacteria bacterium]